jgi:cytochrome d ubiquinol oxidase subunit II
VLYATAFSGFYLPLIIVLWLLMGRALGIEMRLHYALPDPLWKQFWDVIFAVSSFLLALFLGAALGNIIRGVPLDANGTFFEPLWTDFRVGEQTGILDWFTILVGLAAVAAVTYHGGLWLHWHTGNAVRQRTAKALPLLAGLLLVLWTLTLVASVAVQPLLQEQFRARPWLLLFPLGSFLALGASWFYHRRQRPSAAFLASALFVYAVMFSVVAGLYPQVLPARQPALGLTATRAASAPETLRLALSWWIPGMLLVGAYTLFIYRKILPATLGKTK